ncbi:MAG: hypothetical protein GY839_10235 [candidate division Zixibacteria bacterium]|nr:hypothetical protein [candidate division Zixibacteria bacterium]
MISLGVLYFVAILISDNIGGVKLMMSRDNLGAIAWAWKRSDLELKVED